MPGHTQTGELKGFPKASAGFGKLPTCVRLRQVHVVVSICQSHVHNHPGSDDDGPTFDRCYIGGRWAIKLERREKTKGYEDLGCFSDSVVVLLGPCCDASRTMLRCIVNLEIKCAWLVHPGDYLSSQGQTKIVQMR